MVKLFKRKEKVEKEGKLEKRMAHLEEEVSRLKKFLGMTFEVKAPNICPECGEEGKVEKTDEYAKRRYIHYKDEKGHTWFEEEEDLTKR